MKDEIDRRAAVEAVAAISFRLDVAQRIRDQLRIGLDAAARGEVEQFDPEGIKAAGRERLGM